MLGEPRSLSWVVFGALTSVTVLLALIWVPLIVRSLEQSMHFSRRLLQHYVPRCETRWM